MTLHSTQAQTVDSMQSAAILPFKLKPVLSQESSKSISIAIPQVHPVVAGDAKLADDFVKAPIWMDALDATNLDWCSRADIEALMDMAPSDFSRGMLYGQLSVRIESTVLVGAANDGEQSGFDSAVYKIEARLAKLAEITLHESWFDDFEVTNPVSCSRLELDDLMARAPTDLLHGYLYGVRVMRTSLSPVTPFN